MNPKIDAYLDRIIKWKKELSALRSILLDCGLTEVYKWRQPCYQYRNTNIIILGSFKDYCIISFFKGVLLKDTENILIQQGGNTQSARVIKFNSINEINELSSVIKAYIYEAIEIEKAGIKVNLEENDSLKIPNELQDEFKIDKNFNKAFEDLTPGRQRGYLLHFTGAKQSKTRTARIKKYKKRIIDGYGFHDCVCGLSKNMPNCDGSHNKL